MENSCRALDNDGQPGNPAYNWKRNKNKAAATLSGILLGLTCDDELNDTEISFLQNWLENQETRTGDLQDIYEDIARILMDKVITEEENQDLLTSLQDCLEYGPKSLSADARINEFEGFLYGLAADGKLGRCEFDQLCTRLGQYRDIVTKWPFCIVSDALDKILRDGPVSSIELKELCELIQQITGTNFTKDGDAVGGATTMFSSPVPTFKGKHVCITGKFLSGTREQVQSKLVSLGAIPQGGVTRQTDILIIGTFCSRDWIHSSTGRKIERAVELKREGHGLIITNEKVAILNGRTKTKPISRNR